MTQRLFVFVLAFCAAASQGKASIIVSTFGPGGTFSTCCGNPVGSINSTGTRFEYANAFTPSFSYTLDSISVAVDNWAGPNQLTMYLASGITEPGSPIGLYSVTGIPVFPSEGIITFNSTAAPILNAGTRYWVVLSAADLDNTFVSWQASELGPYADWASAQRSASTFPAWIVNPGGGAVMAFEVDGTAAPEPATTALILVGLVLCGFIAKRRDP